MTQHTPPARYPIWLTPTERQLVYAAVRSLIEQQSASALAASLRQVLRQHSTLKQFEIIHQRIRRCLHLPEGVAPVWLTTDEITALIAAQQLPTPLHRRLSPEPREYTEGR